MRSEKIIHVVRCHAAGEVGDVIVGGVSPPPGETLWEQRKWIHQDGTLRNFVLNEPRGGVFRHVNLLVPPKNPQAAMGWIIMEPVHTPPMSGSNSICVATVLLETGIVPMQEPITRFSLEAPGGLVEVEARCSNGATDSVKIFNRPSFCAAMDEDLEVAGLGTLKVDVAYGGDSFVIADAPSLGFSLEPSEARDLAEIGMKIRAAATDQLGFQHPDHPDWAHISFCQIAGPVSQEDGILTGRSAVAIEPGKLDRSPCGTGCSARMAVMHARGQMRVGDCYIGTSLIGSRFICKIESETGLHGIRAILPSLSGQAWITGTAQLMLDPTDPWPQGYRLSDTWPDLPLK